MIAIRVVLGLCDRAGGGERGGVGGWGWGEIYYEVYIYFSFTLLLSNFWTKPWSQVSSLLHPGSCLQFSSRIGFSNPTARRFFIECCLTHALALSASQFVHTKNSPFELVRAGTRGYSIHYPVGVLYCSLTSGLDRRDIVQAGPSKTPQIIPHTNAARNIWSKSEYLVKY